MDLIERSEAVEALEARKDKTAKGEVGGFYNTIIQRDIDAIEQLPPAQPKWIPCSERMPEENGQYLITVKYKHVNDSYEDVYAEHGEWSDGRWDMFCFGHCGEVEDIIAWLPLPEPYRGSENG